MWLNCNRTEFREDLGIWQVGRTYWVKTFNRPWTGRDNSDAWMGYKKAYIATGNERLMKISWLRCRTLLFSKARNEPARVEAK